MISSILTAILTTSAQDAAGRWVKTRVSKTKAAVNVGTGAGVIALLPLALNGDETAIGALVVMLISWGTALWGRWKADQ